MKETRSVFLSQEKGAEKRVSVKDLGGIQGRLPLSVALHPPFPPRTCPCSGVFSEETSVFPAQSKWELGREMEENQKNQSGMLKRNKRADKFGDFRFDSLILGCLFGSSSDRNAHLHARTHLSQTRGHLLTAAAAHFRGYWFFKQLWSCDRG